MATLRKVLKAPFGLTIPKPMLQLGAEIIGTETELVLKSRNVIPGRLIQHGFQFKFDTLEKTFKDLT